MEFEKANAFRSKGRILAVAAVLAVVVSCLAVSAVADAADDDKTLYIQGTLDASIIGSNLQVIVVDGDLTVENGQFIVANNNFIVNENVTLTLKSGSYVKIATGTADIKGKVVCAGGTVEQPTFLVSSGSSATVAGSVAVEGPYGFVMENGATATVGGEFAIAESGSANLTGLTVANGGKLTIASKDAATLLDGVRAESGSNIQIAGSAEYGTVTVQDGSTFVVANGGKLKQIAGSEGSIVNNGALTFNGEFSGKITNNKIVVADSAAEVLYNVVMNDGATFESKGLNGLALFSDNYRAQIELIQVKGVMVKNQSGSMILSGAPVAENSNAAVNVYGDKAVINENMTFPGGVNIDLMEGSTLTVVDPAYVTMTDNTASAPITGTGTLTVTGTVKTAVPLVIKSGSASGIKLNAVYYMKDNFHYYTTFDKALAANPDLIKVYGDIVFDSDTIIPKGMTIDMSEANSVRITERATVTVKDGGVFYNDLVPITVQGTLILENTGTSETNVAIVDSDVLVESGISTKFTNLKRALAEAQSGDIIYLKRNHVYISEDTVIPKGVTLSIGSGHTVEVINGAKLTVNGVLDANPGTFVITSGSTVVNGRFIFDVPFSTYTSQIAGAYFVCDKVNTIAPLSYVAGKESSIGKVVEMYGDNAVGDVSLSGSAQTVRVMSGDFSAGTLSLAGFDFDSANADSVSGKIAIGDGSIDFAKAKGFALTAGPEGGVLVNGDIAPAATGASATMSGKVRVNGDITAEPIFASDADVYLTNDFAFHQGVTIPEGARVTAEKTLSAKALSVAGKLVTNSLTADSVDVASKGEVASATNASLGLPETLKMTVGSLVANGRIGGGDSSVITADSLSGDGTIALGDNCAVKVANEITSLQNLSAGNNLSVTAKKIAFGDASAADGLSLSATDGIASSGTITAKDNLAISTPADVSLKTVKAGSNASVEGKNVSIADAELGSAAKIAAESITLGSVKASDDSVITASGDLAVTGNSSVGGGSQLTANNVTVDGTLEFASTSKVLAKGNLDVNGTLKALVANAEGGSFEVVGNAIADGTMDLAAADSVIGGNLSVNGSATLGDAVVNGNVDVAKDAKLVLDAGSKLAIGKNLDVKGAYEAGANSETVVGADAKGAASVDGTVTTGTGSTFKAASLAIPGTFTSSGNTVISAPEIGGTSTIPGTIDVKAGEFVMYQTVYVYGSILTEAGSFAASKLYIGVNESIFGPGVVPVNSNPVIGSNVTILPDGIAYVSPSVNTNGAFSGFDFTKFHKGDDLYLIVYADPDKYVDSYVYKGESLRRNIDSVYAYDDNAYVNGWRATKTVKDAAEASKARVYDPYGTHEDVWLNSVYNIYNFKLYVADETATPMVGKLVDGKAIPLTLAKTGLNCYESPVDLEAGTYRVALTYALGHEEDLIDNPLVVNGVPQSTYDFTLSGNPENKEHVETLLQFSFEEDEPPIIEPEKSLSITDILLIVIVILIIVVAIAVIMRARRS